MTPEEKYQLFEKYCAQELTANDQKVLDALLDEDPSIREELKLFSELHSHLESRFTSEEELASLKDNLSDIGDNYFKNKTEYHKEKKEVKVIRIPSWAYAAAASVAIIFGLFVFNQSDPTYNEFVDIPQLSITQRAEADEVEKKAEDAFNTKQYAKAEKYLSQLQERSESSLFQYYYGITLLEQDKFDQASVIFNHLYKGKSVYKFKALWFEALNQLKQEKYEECAALLKAIPIDAEDYEKAQKLLKKLN